MTPLLFVLAAAALVLNTIIAQPSRAVVGIVVVLTGVPAYFWWRRQKLVRTTTGLPTPARDSA